MGVPTSEVGYTSATAGGGMFVNNGIIENYPPPFPF